MSRLGRNRPEPVDGPDPSATFRADLEEVLAAGYHGLRGLLLVLAGSQLVERHRSRGVRAAEVAAVSLATVQVAGELFSRRHGRRRPWPLVAATTASGWLIFGLGDRYDGRLPVRGWESEWTNWNPLFARLVDEDRGWCWSALSAVPHLRRLGGRHDRRRRTEALTGLALLGAADTFSRVFGTSLRARADLIDARAGEFVAARSELEEERLSADWRERVVAGSAARLGYIRDLLTRPGADGAGAAALVQAEYETLRSQMVQAGQSDATVGDWEVIRAAELERDAQQLAMDTRRALIGLTRYIGPVTAAMATLGVTSSPPSRRRWIAAAPVVAHLSLLGRPSRTLHLRGDRSPAVGTNFDLAVLAIGYHLSDMATSTDGTPHGVWATTCVTSLAMPAAAGAATPGGAMLPALSYGVARMFSRGLWARDDTNWVEILNTTIYFAWTSWALYRAVDAIWDAEARLERWTTESGRHTAEVVMESNRRRVQLALHDHGVQTLGYLARHGTIPTEQRTDLLDRAIAELSSVARPDEARPVDHDLLHAIEECVDGYRRFGLDPTLSVALGPGTPTLGDPVIQDAINQGLANVLAHSADRRPVVSVTKDRLEFVIVVSNTTDAATTMAPTLGFGLGQLDERVCGLGGTLQLGSEGGVTELRVSLPS